ncbi:hypothetical protein Ctob_000153 [Chrysochromulina tobinii]|uniref:Tetratricopeptide repeat protein n=1 Tax=Chrysochromulina tobinii TaxID=1460289 RepID=A0A0M0J508_9EUKA|nr:hypothetical protein Ctob_000153 [Chrysochromulina tobinii]|eukprot:KOO21298.1 hypothetical protein Ctob_000153 [Chrysochromulina sp. CCMP291]
MRVLATAFAATPSAEAQSVLRKAFTMAAQGFDEPADALLTQSIERQKLFDAALADYTESLRLVQQAGANPDPAELQRTFVLRARVQEALERWKFAEADLTAAIDRLDELDAIESTNPFLFASRGAARSRLGDFSGAAEDALRAEDEFKMIGDRVHRLSSAADSALYLYGADRIPEAVEKMRYVFQNKGVIAQGRGNWHLAYAAHLFGADRRTDADTQWESGCIRLEAFVEDGIARLEEERALREADEKRADETGTMQRQRASSVSAMPLGQLTPNSDTNARLMGMDPQSPYVTQRPATGWIWYKTSEGDVERRDPGLPLVEVDPTLSCAKFRSDEWLTKNRPEWPSKLRAATARYAEVVPQKPIVMPPKGSQPSKGELVF